MEGFSEAEGEIIGESAAAIQDGQQCNVFSCRPYNKPCCAQVSVVFLVDASECMPSSKDWPAIWEKQEAWKASKAAHENSAKNEKAASEKEEVRTSTQKYSADKQLQFCGPAGLKISTTCDLAHILDVTHWRGYLSVLDFGFQCIFQAIGSPVNKGNIATQRQ